MELDDTGTMPLEYMTRVQELVKFAKENSPYYSKRYENVPETISHLNQLPMVDHTSFWVANTGLPPENRVLTSSSFIDAAVFRTGGTTAVPKTSFVTRQELREGAQNMVNCLTRAGLRPGDHVANLLYGGDLYKGFLDLSLALIEATVPTLHLPIGVAPLDAQAWTIRSFSATVLVSMPTVVCRLADYLIEHKELPNTVRLILYIGELLHNDQKKLLRQAFPSARIGPLQYASVDGGFIGAPDSLPTNDDDDATIYAVNTQSMILELVTDDGELITEEGVRGNVLITNLARRLMPTIRYPMGDLAEWTDYRTRKFRLCGRGMVAVRIAHYSFDLSTLKAVVSSVMTSDTFTGFQVIVKREEATDVMIFRVASQPKDPDRLAREMQEALARIKTDWAEEFGDWEIQTSFGRVGFFSGSNDQPQDREAQGDSGSSCRMTFDLRLVSIKGSKKFCSVYSVPALINWPVMVP